MTVILARHGETEANQARLYLGHTDSPLTEKGRKQAADCARKLRDLGVCRVYSSDLGRCRATAAEFQALTGHIPIYARELRELNFGAWEGHSYEELMAANPVHAEQWYEDPFTVAPPDGETLLELGRRLDAWLAGVLSEAGSSNRIAIITHGGPIRWWLCKHIHGNPQFFWRIEGLGHGEIRLMNLFQ